MIDRHKIESEFRLIQDEICQALETSDGGGKFMEDKWERSGGGGGRSRVFSNGNVIEKGGVNFSAVFGKAPDFLVKQLNASADAQFFATGVSIVLHPHNPLVPIIHMNIRYFEMDGGINWFGGGIDLTPHYVKHEDAVFFHQSMKNVCDKHDKEYYSRFKKWADNYFFIKHRNETRGIGGIFFDQLKEDDKKTKSDLFSFVNDVGRTFAPTYIELMNRNRNLQFNEKQKQWQLLRRGRYVEFNLVYDRGTKFGLETDGRAESILMSMPPQANWIYNFVPEKDSLEDATLKLLVKGIDWI